MPLNHIICVKLCVQPKWKLHFPFSLAGEILHQEETLPEIQREDADRRLHSCWRPPAALLTTAQQTVQYLQNDRLLALFRPGPEVQDLERRFPTLLWMEYLNFTLFICTDKKLHQETTHISSSKWQHERLLRHTFCLLMLSSLAGLRCLISRESKTKIIG